MSKLEYWRQVYTKLPLKEFMQEINWKATQTGQLYSFILHDKYLSSEVSSSHGLKVLGGDKNYRNNLPPFFINPKEKESCPRIAEQHLTSAQTKKIIRDAGLICQRHFRFLGQDVAFPKGIQWHTDFKTGHRWDKNKRYFQRKDLPSVEVGNGTDNKVPWEISRLQFIIPLGKAYWLTGDEKYAQHFFDIVSDWMENNPPYYGVNWCSAMEAAIRAANLIWGIYFFSPSPIVNQNFFLRLVSLLERHGRFIWGNLEKWFEATGNHYLADLAGLIYLGVFLKKPKWLNFGIREMRVQIQRQVLEDGVSFESSTGYHRLAMECLLYPALLCRENKISLPEDFWNRLKKMFIYTKDYIKPNHHAPQIGDNDSGRFHILGSYAITDHSYLMPLAEILFKDEQFALYGQPIRKEILWLFTPQALEAKHEGLIAAQYKPASRAYKTSGIYIMRRNNAYMLINCAPNGFYGKGSHAHNDKLSFELNFQGEDFIVDPGSYIYTPHPEERDLFRSTACHNTVRIDGKEQNRIPANDTFKLENDCRPQLIDWQSDTEQDIFKGKHGGYTRLTNPVEHTRQIVFNKKLTTWRIVDAITGKGQHLLEWYFHLAPQITAEVSSAADTTQVRLCGKQHNLVIETDTSTEIKLLPGYYSPEYGCKEKAVFIYLSTKVALPYSKTFLIKPIN